MAARSLTVVAQVKDAASSSLKKIGRSFDDTNKAIKKSSVNFTEFNRVLFSTTAFVGVFTKAFSMLHQSLTQASELERVSNQFQRVVGPRGALFTAIRSMTSNSIDRMEAMRSGIALSSLGIIKDTNQMAEVMARSGTVAKRAGLQSGEGIKKITSFLKDGSIAHLSFLNVIAATNPQLQAQMAILQKAGGVMGTVISTQARLKLGMQALRAASSGMADDQRDLMDTLADMGQSFNFLKGEISSFLGKALSPMIDKVSDFAFSAVDLVERIKNTDKTLLQTVKNLFLVGSALTSVVATLGSARLLFKALGALGIGGIPFVTLSILGLAAAFTDVQKATESFTNMVKSMGAILLGSFQLVSSFINDSDNFAKGIGKMDGELHAFLQKQGLLHLTKNIARVSAAIITFTKDVGNTLVNWFNSAADSVSFLTNKISKLFSFGEDSAWSRGLIEGGEGIRGTLVGITATAIAAFGAFKAFSVAKGMLSKVPLIGGLFGGKSFSGSGPKGTRNDPVHTVGVESGLGNSLIDRIRQTIRPTGAHGPLAPGQTSIPIPDTILGFNKAILTTIGKLGLLGAAFAAGAAIGWGINKMLEQTFGPSIDNMLEKLGQATGLLYKHTPQDKDPLHEAKLAVLSELKARAQRNGKDFVAPGPKALEDLARAVATGKGDMLGKLNEGTGNFINAVNAAGARGNVEEITKTTDTAKKVFTPTISTTGQAVIPSMPTEENRLQALQLMLQNIDQQFHDRTKAAIDSAISGTSAGGTQITLEEWKAAMMAALDESKLTKKTEEVANKPQKTILNTTKRC